jgi:hypothetical protein
MVVALSYAALLFFFAMKSFKWQFKGAREAAAGSCEAPPDLPVSDVAEEIRRKTMGLLKQGQWLLYVYPAVAVVFLVGFYFVTEGRYPVTPVESHADTLVLGCLMFVYFLIGVPLLASQMLVRKAKSSMQNGIQGLMDYFDFFRRTPQLNPVAIRESPVLGFAFLGMIGSISMRSTAVLAVFLVVTCAFTVWFWLTVHQWLEKKSDKLVKIAEEMMSL